MLRGNTAELVAVLADIEAAHPPTVILSSEEFVFLHAYPERATFLRNVFAARGFDVTLVVYVRAQAAYIESTYAELTKTFVPPPFGAFVDELLARGEVRLGEGIVPFEYDRIVLGLAANFGPENIVVRPYAEQPAPRALLDDFLHVVARIRGGLDLHDLRLSLAHANVRGTFGQVLNRLAEAAGVYEANRPAVDPAVANAPFAPLRRDDVIAIVERFSASNAALETMARIAIPGTRLTDVADASDPRWQVAQAQRALLDRIAGELGGSAP